MRLMGLQHTSEEAGKSEEGTTRTWSGSVQKNI
jgi:hypothetical protein